MCKDFRPHELYCDPRDSFIKSYGAFPCSASSRLATIHDTQAWYDFYKARDMKSAQSRIQMFKNGCASRPYIEYEKGVSFKCICGKWAHPRFSQFGCTKIYHNSMPHTVFEKLVKTTKVWVHGRARARCVDPSDRTHDFEEESDACCMACGFCTIPCVFCNKIFLLSCAAENGCCLSAVIYGLRRRCRSRRISRLQSHN